MSALGLNWAQRYAARKRVKRAALLAARHRGVVHYTQGASRWQGISSRRRAKDGQYPNYADCSSLATWCHWDATRIYGLGDYVNGANWKYGYTGTQVQHGKPVALNRLLTGDLVFYGRGPSHVAIYIGGGKVVSHGGESGPLILPVQYRPVHSCRRFIR